MSEVSQGHIVAAYDEEFKKLTKLLSKMGGLAESQLANALTAIEKRDSKLTLALPTIDLINLDLDWMLAIRAQ